MTNPLRSKYTFVNPKNPESKYRFEHLGPDGSGVLVGYVNGLYCTKEVMDDWQQALVGLGFIRHAA